MATDQRPHGLRSSWPSRRMRTGCRYCDPNVLLLGPPGVGQSRLARRLTSILPPMRLAEALETTRIHRVAGLTGDRAVSMTVYPASM
jgi:predicted ATPase with chaperone activity